MGSANVATADPVIPAPPTTACTVTLFENQTFADFSAKPFTYEPPADCPGPWQKVVLTSTIYNAPNDTCYSRQITATAGVLTQVTDGAGCPGGNNFLLWFDSFLNYASSVAGDTVQMLP